MCTNVHPVKTQLSLQPVQSVIQSHQSLISRNGIGSQGPKVSCGQWKLWLECKESSFIRICWNCIYSNDLKCFRQTDMGKQCRTRSDDSWRSSLVKVYTVSHSLCIFWMPCCVVKPFETRHEKTNNVTVPPVKTQISLGIYPIWSESLLCA